MMLFFVNTNIPPAVAGVVIAQVVLIMVTNNINSAILGHLPAGANSCFLSSFVPGSLSCQMVQLVAHMCRMHMIHHQVPTQLRFITVGSRMFFTWLFILVEGVACAVFHESDPTTYILLSLAGLGAILVPARLYCKYDKIVDKSEPSWLLNVLSGYDKPKP